MIDSDDSYLIQIVNGKNQSNILWKIPFETEAKAVEFAAMFPVGTDVNIIRIFETCEITRSFRVNGGVT